MHQIKKIAYVVLWVRAPPSLMTELGSSLTSYSISIFSLSPIFFFSSFFSNVCPPNLINLLLHSFLANTAEYPVLGLPSLRSGQYCHPQTKYSLPVMQVYCKRSEPVCSCLRYVIRNLRYVCAHVNIYAPVTSW